MGATFAINNRDIGPGYPTYIIAEMSANHSQSFEQAAKNRTRCQRGRS